MKLSKIILAIIFLASIGSATASFPSGHITFIVPIALTVWLMSRKRGSWFLLGAVLIGVGRVAVGIHWPSDILGGFLIGGLSFATVYYLLRWKGASLVEFKNQNSKIKITNKSSKFLAAAE